MTKQAWKQTVVITGAGSGFGAALALKYARAGWDVAVTDIDKDRAEQTLSDLSEPGGKGFAMRLDITNADEWQQLNDAVMTRWGGLQLLINNAGVATAGNIEDTSIEDWLWVLDINLMGVVRGCRQFVGTMKKQGGGHIVNVSSFAGLAGLPFVSSYGVAKAGVVALSEALRAEMHPFGVGVTVVCPAFVKTALLDTFRTNEEGTKDLVSKWMETSRVTSEQVADEIIKAVEKNKFLLLTHTHTRIAWRLKRWLPERYFKSVLATQKS